MFAKFITTDFYCPSLQMLIILFLLERFMLTTVEWEASQLHRESDISNS